MIFEREDTPVKILSSEDKPIEAFFFKFIFLKNKLLVCCSCNPNNNVRSYSEALRKGLDLYSAYYYEKTILLGDFNVSANNPFIEYSCESSY